MLDGGSLKMWMGISDSVHDTGKLLFASLDPQNCTRAGNFVPDLILHQSRSIFDKPGRFLRMRHVGHMAGHSPRPSGHGRASPSSAPWSGLIERSAVATMYQVGLLFQAGDRDLVGERVGGNRHLRHSLERRLILRNVRCDI
jgi:hypothetical protein